jgi:hypothetical protein
MMTDTLVDAQLEMHAAYGPGTPATERFNELA